MPPPSRSWKVEPFTVAGASGSLNVAVTAVPTSTFDAPAAGATAVTVGGAAAASAAICWKRSWAAW